MAQHVDNNEDIFLPRSDRLQILSAEEYELLWGRPRFSQSDRDLFFALTASEFQILGRLRTPRTVSLQPTTGFTLFTGSVMVTAPLINLELTDDHRHTTRPETQRLILATTHRTMEAQWAE